MSVFDTLRADPEFAALRDLSARLGAERLQVQGPGGNTSLKRGGAMWIKASGTWLAEALRADIMVPVALDALLGAIAAGDPAAEAATDFTPQDLNPAGLRPSIETSVHAVIPAPVVLHTHCVATVATAMRADAAEIVAERLGDLGGVHVPYVKPGLELARAIRTRLRADTRVLVLGNHGLVACGETCAAAEAALREATRRLEPATAEAGRAAPELAAALARSDYAPADNPATHDLARDPERLRIAAAGSYYPDHVIFLGPAVAVARPGETIRDAADRIEATTGRRPVLLLAPGLGAAVRADASGAARALVSCLGDVMARVDPAARLTALSPAQEAELLDWDAEKYRQTLDAARDRDRA